VFSDYEITVLIFHSSGLVLSLLTAIVLFIVALFLQKQNVSLAKYIIVTSIMYLLLTLASPIFAGYAGASPSFNELDFKVHSELIKVVAALFLLASVGLLLIAIKGRVMNLKAQQVNSK